MSYITYTINMKAFYKDRKYKEQEHSVGIQDIKDAIYNMYTNIVRSINYKTPYNVNFPELIKIKVYTSSGTIVLNNSYILTDGKYKSINGLILDTINGIE